MKTSHQTHHQKPTGELFPTAERAELVQAIHGQPMTSTRRVAQMFNRLHKNVLRDVERLRPDLPDDFARLNFEPSEYIDDTGRHLPEYLLTQDGFLMLAMGFTGKEAARWRASFIAAFNAMSKALQRQQNALLSTERMRVRAEVAHSHSSVIAVLIDTRMERGKTTEPHHIANEVRLIGYAMTGEFMGLDRDTLDADQLRLLHRVETLNIKLLVRGASYETRKTELRALVLQELPPPDDAPQIGGAA